MQEITIYSTLGCHLCELAKVQLYPVLERGGFCLMEVDIADNPTLLEQYGLRIPVITSKGIDGDLGWPFDTDDVVGFLRLEA